MVLEAAEDILTQSGPEGLKLKAVADKAGVSHGNVLHHFGTIEGLQGALMARLSRRLADRVITLANVSTPDQQFIGEGLNNLFDMFADPAISRLAAWLIMRGDADSLANLEHAFDDALTAVKAAHARGVGADRSPQEVEDFFALSIVVAMGTGLFGPITAAYMRADPGRIRAMAAGILLRMLNKKR